MYIFIFQKVQIARIIRLVNEFRDEMNIKRFLRGSELSYSGRRLGPGLCSEQIRRALASDRNGKP